MDDLHVERVVAVPVDGNGERADAGGPVAGEDTRPDDHLLGPGAVLDRAADRDRAALGGVAGDARGDPVIGLEDVGGVRPRIETEVETESHQEGEDGCRNHLDVALEVGDRPEQCRERDMLREPEGEDARKREHEERNQSPEHVRARPVAAVGERDRRESGDRGRAPRDVDEHADRRVLVRRAPPG